MKFAFPLPKIIRFNPRQFVVEKNFPLPPRSELKKSASLKFVNFL